MLVSRDCGPEGCEVYWLASRQYETELDVEAFTKLSMEKGWGDATGFHSFVTSLAQTKPAKSVTQAQAQAAE